MLGDTVTSARPGCYHHYVVCLRQMQFELYNLPSRRIWKRQLSILIKSTSPPHSMFHVRYAVCVEIGSSVEFTGQSNRLRLLNPLLDYEINHPYRHYNPLLFTPWQDSYLILLADPPDTEISAWMRGWIQHCHVMCYFDYASGGTSDERGESGPLRDLACGCRSTAASLSCSTNYSRNFYGCCMKQFTWHISSLFFLRSRTGTCISKATRTSWREHKMNKWE